MLISNRLQPFCSSPWGPVAAAGATSPVAATLIANFTIAASFAAAARVSAAVGFPAAGARLFEIFAWLCGGPQQLYSCHQRLSGMQSLRRKP